MVTVVSQPAAMQWIVAETVCWLRQGLCALVETACKLRRRAGSFSLFTPVVNCWSGADSPWPLSSH